METEYLECKCGSSEHILRFVYDDGDGKEEPEIYTEVLLHMYMGFFHRLWLAFKYVFGFRSQYGHYDCWLMKEEDSKKLKKIIDRYEKDFKNYKKSCRTY